MKVKKTITIDEKLQEKLKKYPKDFSISEYINDFLWKLIQKKENEK